MSGHRPFAVLGYAVVKRQRDELRAVLAPLLDEPMVNAPCMETGAWVCRFCSKNAPDGTWAWPSADTREEFEHAADCPVLRRDVLLGRS